MKFKQYYGREMADVNNSELGWLEKYKRRASGWPGNHLTFKKYLVPLLEDFHGRKYFMTTR